LVFVICQGAARAVSHQGLYSSAIYGKLADQPPGQYLQASMSFFNYFSVWPKLYRDKSLLYYNITIQYQHSTHLTRRIT